MNRLLAVLACISLLTACEREDREYRPDPAASGLEPRITMGSLSIGPSPPTGGPSLLGAQYETNAYHVSQGKKFYTWFNCNGCHANGGGDSGPALIDDRWIYGGGIDNIALTILEGRPNGMPSFRGKLTDEQAWQLAAYVRSMSGNIAIDVAPGRNDDLNAHEPESQIETQPPVNGGLVPAASQMPQ